MLKNYYATKINQFFSTFHHSSNANCEHSCLILWQTSCRFVRIYNRWKTISIIWMQCLDGTRYFNRKWGHFFLRKSHVEIISLSKSEKNYQMFGSFYVLDSAHHLNSNFAQLLFLLSSHTVINGQKRLCLFLFHFDTPLGTKWPRYVNHYAFRMPSIVLHWELMSFWNQ